MPTSKGGWCDWKRPWQSWEKGAVRRELLRRIERLEIQIKERPGACTLKLPDGRWRVVDVAEVLDLALALSAADDDVERRPLNRDLASIVAQSIPEAGEGTLISGLRERCRHYLNGEQS
ncbi:MAG: hypothetical protein QJR03_15290 [Sphaerobacter sp.]|nr:hypothetical protein [Sphaerobacter sp.]